MLGDLVISVERAEEQAKDIAKRLIGLESHLAQDMQSYL